ncbi:MAG: DUF2490 domain-containing protein [Nitrosomonas sp.]|nr:DUF2490 domain-containing protein [Nitrosomonas sp.]
MTKDFKNKQFKGEKMLRKIRIKIFLVSTILALTIGISNSTLADDVVDDFQFWGNITATGSFDAINPKLKWWMEGQGRFGNDSSRFSQGIIRPGIGYALTENTSVWLGYAWIPTSRPFAANKAFNENRIWQQLLWSKRYSFGSITSRTRLEQRFFDFHRSGSTADGHGHRFRQFLKLTVPMPSVSPNLSFVVLDEIFINMNNVDTGARAGFNQNRAFGGFAWRFNKFTVGEIGYLHQYFNRPASPRPDQQQHILAVNLFLNF